MNYKELEMAKRILGDVEFLNINRELDDNSYYYELIMLNLSDLIDGVYK